jgi:O-antigen ligase
LGALIVFVGIGVTQCHFAQFLAILGIIIFALLHYKNKWIRISIIILCLIGVIILLKIDYAKLGLNMSGRLDAWKIALKVVKHNPLFGSGMGFWKSLQVKIDSTVWFSVHNDWLERMVEIGIIGVFLGILVVINAIKNFRFTEKLNYGYFSMFIVFLVMCFGSFPLETASVGMLGLVSFWGMEHL